jgi:hypothetical protein
VEVLRSAYRHAIDAADIDHALRNAVVVDEIAEDPLRWLVLGPDRAGNLLELVVLDPSPGPGGYPRDADDRPVPQTAAGRMTKMTQTHGTKADGSPITDEVVEAMADEAEHGYDTEQIIARRRGGRPPMGSSASSVESVRLDPDLKRDLLLRAAEEHISVSEAIRRAIGDYLRAAG